jgi:hypothetical protein
VPSQVLHCTGRFKENFLQTGGLVTILSNNLMKSNQPQPQVLRLLQGEGVLCAAHVEVFQADLQTVHHIIAFAWATLLATTSK